MPFLEFNGAKIYYETEGAGPAVVFIHAGIADSRMWDDQWAAFAEHYQVIRYDTRGYGQTVGSEVSYSNRADLRAILDHLGIEKAALIGCSRGGQIAIDAILENPERVWTYISVCGGLSGFVWDAVPQDQHDALEEAERLFESREWDAVLEAEARIWVDGFHRSPDQVSETVRDKMIAMNRQSFAHLDEGGESIPLDPPAVNRLAQVQCPALIMIGELDASHVLARGNYLAENITDAQKYIFKNAAHLPNMEHPEEFNRVALAFLDEAQKSNLQI
ncbi:MAG: alpha/beta hydrolase [Chloroflexi bacterium OLB15]|nr:MAG: alpha/beta hydrolase [Chloroflexi bacterium OLB15]